MNDLHALQREGYITAQMCRAGRDVIGMVIREDTVYPTISPDDGGVCFYWVAGDRSITIDLYPEGGVWQCVRNGDSRQVWADGGIRREMWDAIAEFSAAVEAANPTWRDLYPDPINLT